jgi:5'-methylthioadenosine phosphorylase
MAAAVRIGVIGGSGLYQMDGLTDVVEHRVTTPWGDPSDVIVGGRLGDAEVFFLPRHGRGHRLLPTEVNYRANVWALRQLGCAWVLSVSAVGSLREEIAPGDVVIVDQFLDRTRSRASTFLGQGLVAHVQLGDPVCGRLRAALLDAATAEGARAHDGGTYVCMEGPAFSTRAESEAYRQTGASVIGMTNLPEAKLAREAEMSYATLALATDYDCWRVGHEEVSVEAVVAVMHRNVALARRIIANLVPRVVALGPTSPFAGTLAASVLTDPAFVTDEVRQRFAPLLDAFPRAR